MIFTLKCDSLTKKYILYNKTKIYFFFLHKIFAHSLYIFKDHFLRNHFSYVKY